MRAVAGMRTVPVEVRIILSVHFRSCAVPVEVCARMPGRIAHRHRKMFLESLCTCAHVLELRKLYLKAVAGMRIAPVEGRASVPGSGFVHDESIHAFMLRDR